MLSLYTTTDDADAGDHMQSIINVRQSSECVAVCQVDVWWELRVRLLRAADVDLSVQCVSWLGR